MITRVLFVQITGESQFQVDRMAMLVEDQIKSTSLFIATAMEVVAAEGASADDPIPESPTVKVSQMVIHGGGEHGRTLTSPSS